MAHWGKNVMLYVLNFKKGQAHMSIYLYRFSMHEIFKMYLPTLSISRKTINTQLLDHLKDPELLELVKIYQVHAYSGTYLKYNKNESCYSCGRYFTEKIIIAKPLDSKFSNDKKEEHKTSQQLYLK